MDFLFWTLAAIGNFSVWFSIYCRVHAGSLPRPIRKGTEKFCAAMLLISFAWMAYSSFVIGSVSVSEFVNVSWRHRIYLCLCIGIGTFEVLFWCWRKWNQKTPDTIIEQTRSLIDLQQRIGESVYATSRARMLSAIPQNKSHVLAIEEVTLRIPRLPERLDGLKIAHLSDLHLMRMLSRRWFEEVIHETNRHQPDLVLVTGDLVDEDKCIDWIDPVFGNIESKHGTFFIRGNHDRRVSSQSQLLRALADSKMTWVGDGKWHSLTINDIAIEIAGNELPWFGETKELPVVANNGGLANPKPFRILLAHSPDQHLWALEQDFDLILAGHCHGGQIQIPGIGPLVAPSKYRTKFASGTFEFGNSVMRVSRGVSGDKCLRIFCPPEVGVLTLRN